MPRHARPIRTIGGAAIGVKRHCVSSDRGDNPSTFRKLDKDTHNHISRLIILSADMRMSLASPNRAPAGWSRKRKASLIVFALIMAYLQSFYILGFYTSDIEYWGTV